MKRVSNELNCPNVFALISCLQVLVIDAKADQLLMCGSVRQGSCSKHALTDITANTQEVLNELAPS